MTTKIAIRGGYFAIAGLTMLLYAGGAGAQTATASGVGKTQPQMAAQGYSGADAAAYAKLNAGQVDDAADAFQAVLAAQPKDAGALAGMGQVRMQQGNYLGAVSFLEQAKQASPNDAAIASALDGARFQFLMGEGKDALTAKDDVDAEKRFREALELRPDARQAVDALVNVLVEQNKLTDAQDVLSTAVAQGAAASGHPPVDVEMELAQLDIANNQPQLAYPIFLQVLQDSPGRVDAWSGLISALHLMGHDADAVAQEKVVPAETRAQLEATPGFQQMMLAMTNSPTQPAAGQPAYTPFVPSVTAEAPVVPVPVVASPSTSVVANVLPPSTPQRATAGVRPSAPHTAMMPAHGKAAAAMPVQAAQAPVTQPLPSSHSAKAAASSVPLVTQPAARPVGRNGDVPDTGEQQYPQPKARPRTASAGSGQQ